MSCHTDGTCHCADTPCTQGCLGADSGHCACGCDHPQESDGSCRGPATSSQAHEHEPYSYHGGIFRCLCGASAFSGAGPWGDDGTRGCKVCAAPTSDPSGACEWHRTITPDDLV